MEFDGILFFPVTPFDAQGRVDTAVLEQHLTTTLAHRPGGVFPACGTGEFHALSAAEAATVVRTTVDAVGGAVLGALPLFWTVLLPLLAIALVVLSVIHARRETAANPA